MNDDDLKILGRLKAPESSQSAREKAVLSAMEAFDGAGEAKISTLTQGSANGARPTSIVNTLWSTIMTSVLKPVWEMKPAAMAAVAGVLVLPLAGVVAWNVVQPGGLPVGETLSGSSPAPVAGRAEGKREQVAAALKDLKPLQEQAANPAADSVTVSEPRRREGARNFVVAKSRSGQQSITATKPGAGGLLSMESPAVMPLPAPSPAPPVADNEKYTSFDDNGVNAVFSDPVSTFSIDVDTASFARVRAMLNAGNLPPKDMVRVEELVNYFDYDYPLPETKDQPFKPTVTIMPTPWNEHTKLMHIGIKGYDVVQKDQPKANLVFLLDVSGSMNSPDKLPLLIKSFRLLLQKLNPTDTVSVVTYAGRAATVLKPTEASQQATILDALENLRAGGSTGGAQGIEQAYRLAQESFFEGGVNRVMLATDGDFNVGISDPEQLKDFISEKRKSGIFLSVFGFGTGNYNDALMQSLAQNGNGQAAYIDTLAEAQKVLVEEAGSSLFPIASDVKIQMEFNPAVISEYRLIGYETRALKREDFNNDKVDAGDIGAGHTVTAIYELTPVGSPAVLNDPLRYGKDKPQAEATASTELGFLKMRYKLPGESTSKLLNQPVTWDDQNASPKAQQEARFATAVAAFGQKLRGNPMVSDMSYDNIAVLAHGAKGDDKFGYRSAFVQLVRMAGSLAK